MEYKHYADIEIKMLETLGSDVKVMQKLMFDESTSKWEFQEMKDMFKKAFEEHNTGVFQFANVVYRITCPVFIAKRIVRHKGLSIYEVSRSKKFGEPEFYIPLEIDSAEDEQQSHLYEYIGAKTMEMYRALNDKDVKPFYAKIMFNETVMTTLYVNGSVLAWLRFLTARLNSEREMQKICNELRVELHSMFPAISSAYWSKVVKEGGVIQ